MAVAIAVLCLLLCLLQITQNLHFLIAAPVIQSQIQRRLVDDDSGFISIDCGLGTGSYYSSGNGLYYTSDDKYISSGNNMGVSPTFNDGLNEDFLKTVRSFPEGRRNCYNLHPLQPNTKYLIRVWFMYGNYDFRNSTPEFDVYIGVNFWHSVKLTGTYSRYFNELIHLATTESIDVCLVNTGQGTPFISALELRPLDSSAYPASPDSSLKLQLHDDVGGFVDIKGSVTVKDDAYDRLWFRSPIWSWNNIINTTESSFGDSQANPFKVPTSVLSTAGEQNSTQPSKTGDFSIDDSTAPVYAFWHIAELELLGSNDTREFTIFVPHGKGYTFGPIAPKYLQLTTVSSPRISLYGSQGFEYTVMKTNKSSLYPIINAFELYTVLNLPVSPTNRVDVDAITAIRDSYQVPRIWQGDPCLPVNYQWDGLDCTYDDNNPPRISSLSLASSNLTGDLPTSLSKLTSLKYLNLSNNGFTGAIPEFLAYLPSLIIIDLTGNNLMGPIPLQLAEKANNKSIELRLAGNPNVCNSYLCEETEVNKKRRQFIIPILTCVALVSLFVAICSIFLAFKWRKKKQEGLVEEGIKPKNKRFNSSDIAKITGNFMDVIGRGGFASVYSGVLQEGTKVAVKVLNNASSTITMKQFCAEAELLTRIHHVNLVSLIGYCDEHTNMALVYEYMCCGNLQMHLSESNEHPLSWKVRLQISVDAAQGLEYLHSGCQPPIIHRDIKPANILLDEMGHAKIADFGLSRFFIARSQGTPSMTGVAGTQGYLDPEYCQPINTLSEKSDVYAFGIVLLQLLTGQPTIVKNEDIEDEDDTIHIIEWVMPKVERGDILAIIDKRLQGDLIVNSAWMFLEIAMECVKPTGNQRPRMSKVVADLKMCYASHEFHEKNLVIGVDNGNQYMNSIQAIECGSNVSLPSPR